MLLLRSRAATAFAHTASAATPHCVHLNKPGGRDWFVFIKPCTLVQQQQQQQCSAAQQQTAAALITAGGKGKHRRALVLKETWECLEGLVVGAVQW
jgi:hypothetical protein